MLIWVHCRHRRFTCEFEVDNVSNFEIKNYGWMVVVTKPMEMVKCEVLREALWQ